MTAAATTYLSPSITNPAAILEAMTHEIGHPEGFGECPSCDPTDSVMATKIQYQSDNDVIGRATSPTKCDDAALATNYPPCDSDMALACENAGNSWDQKTCKCIANTFFPGDGGGGGGGGGGYCTPYYWHYYESWDGGDTWEEVGDPTYAGCW